MSTAASAMPSNGGSDAKKRKPPNNDAFIETSTKKIKVQAQRKFAQNAVTPANTQKLVQSPVVPSNTAKPLIKRPNTEDFLTFLCFRGTSLLPPRLDFFNKPQRSAQEIAAGKKRRKSTPVLPVSNITENPTDVNDQPSEKKETKQLPSNTGRITKLGKKVIGRNLVRSSSRYTVRQEALTLRQRSLHHGSKIKKSKLKVKKPSPVTKTIRKEIKENGKQKSLDGKKVPTLKCRSTRSNSLPSIFCPGVNQLRDHKGKWCKRDGSKTSSSASNDSKVVEERPSRKKTASKNTDHRSNSLGNLKQKLTDIKCKMTNTNDRKTRSLAGKHKKSDQDNNYVIPNKKSDKILKTSFKNNKANSLNETKLLTVDVKRKTLSVNNMKTSRENKDTYSLIRSRPPRRTKEAATLYMEMLRKDLRCPDEQEDETSSVESFPDLPNTRINEQRERELKVFSKQNMVEKEHGVKKLSENKNKFNDKYFSSLANNKKSVVDNNVREKKKGEESILKKKSLKETVKNIAISENDGTLSFKRNLRPRRSSTMLDDYIMTDSEEDDFESEPITAETKKCEVPESFTVTTAEEKFKKCKLSVEEPDKKKIKTNKTDSKPKQDLKKIDSEMKKNLAKSKSKDNLLNHAKEPEIKNVKNTTAEKKTEKFSKHKTETIVITKKSSKSIGEDSKNVIKKVPLSNKHKKQLMKKVNVSNKKKLDLYNNNGNKKKSTLIPVISSSSPSIFSGDTSQTKKDVLEHMAANFYAKVDAEKPIINRAEEEPKVEEEKKEHTVTTPAFKTKIDANKGNEVDKLDSYGKSVVQCNKQELKNITKMENMGLTAKEEHVNVVEKTENVIAVRTVDKVKKTESLQLVMPFNKVESAVFQTMAKDLFLQAQKNEFKVTVPKYLVGKDFQLSKQFKQDDGLSVLSEICSTLPRFDKPTLQCNKVVEKNEDKSCVVAHPALLPPSLPSPSSFESRTVKIVNLARGNNTITTAVMNDQKDLTMSWKQVLKNPKLQKNGFTSTVIPVGNNLMHSCTENKLQSNEMKQTTSIITSSEKSSSWHVSGDFAVEEKKLEPSASYLCQKTSSCDSKSDVFDAKRGVQNSSYLAKTTILNSTKYDLKFEKRHSAAVVTNCEKPLHQQQRKDVEVSSSDDLQSPEKKIFGHQRRLSATQSFNSNSSDAFSPDNETSVYAFQPDLPVASTPFRRNKPLSPAKSRTVSPNTSISVSIENDSMEEKSLQSTVSSSTDADSEEGGRLFYIPLPAGVQAQPLIQGVTVKLGTEGPQNKLVMSAKLVTKPPALTIPVSSISPKLERKIKPLCSTKINNSSTPVGTVQPTTRTVQPAKCVPSTSKQLLPLLPQPQNTEKKDEKKRLQQITTAITNKELKKSSSSFSVSVVDNRKRKKTEKQVNKRKSSEKVASKKKFLKECADIMEAPTFYPSEEDFKDPLEYFDIVKPVAQKYGICRVVPPPSFKPECKVSDGMRFTAYNQYVHKMMDRWGPNVRELIAMKKYLKTQSIVLSNPPLIGGVELDLPRLYHTVQELGGLKEVIELDKWCRVADLMKIPKNAQVSKLDDIYCKYLLPYDTLSHEERQKLIAEVDKEWKQICKKGDSENELYEDVNDCIKKGRSIALSAYYRVARNTAAMWYKEQQNQGGSSSLASSAAVSNKQGTPVIQAEEVESLYWKQVCGKKNHICVLSGSIDSGAEGYGFPTTKTATFTQHPWNLKVLTNNSASVLKSLGPVMGMTVPTIHMGMMFSACCWYKDPHGLPWIEYLHTGADKVWYGVPSGQSDKFQAAMKRLLPRAVAEGQNHHSWLAADSGMVPPNMLIENGVNVTRTIQNPGQFLLVMPRAYTCNVSTGYVISESVYFTQSNWLNGAEKIFQDLQRNCEPAAFSLEKLLINMSSDTRTPQYILKQLLGILSNMRDCEVALRSQLVEDLGLKASERIRPGTSKSNEQDDDYECDVCHSILYISMVKNSHEDCDYCLRHGIEILTKKHNQLKYCKFMYTFDEDELDAILVKLRERID